MGDMHISIAVLDGLEAQGALDQPVLDADVQVTLKPLDHAGEAFTLGAASQETLLGYYYETDFKVPTAGRWQASIAVTGQTGAGNANFEVEVLAMQRINWRIVLGIVIALLISIGLYGRRAKLVAITTKTSASH